MCQIEIGLSSQGCCLTSARSQRRLSTIYPQTTKISNTEPEQVPKTYDSQANIIFGEQTTTFPVHLALLK